MARTRGLKLEDIEGKLAPSEKLATMIRRTPGAVGCHFSQVQVMKDALSRDKHAVVMEDDLIFSFDFDKRFEYIHNWTQTHPFDVVWLGASFHCNPPYWHRKGGSQDMRSNCSAELGYDAKLTDDPRMIRTYGAFATFAYIVNKTSIQKIVDLLDSVLHESIGIDWAFVKLQPQLKCYSFVPGCVRQFDSISDIGNGITYWSGFLKLNGTLENSAYVYQNLMTDFEPSTFNWAEVAS
jgi:GR25 family glycosyltransferase involved in LPS biosynthesis